MHYLNTYILLLAVHLCLATLTATEPSAEKADSDYMKSIVVAIAERDVDSVSAVVSKLDEQQIHDFRRLVEDMVHSPFKETLTFVLVDHLAKHNGEFTFNYALNQAMAERQRLAMLALESWAESDPYEAWEFFLITSNFGNDRSFKAERLIASIARKDIEMAIRFYGELTDQIGCVSCSAQHIIRRIFYEEKESQFGKYTEKITDPFKLRIWNESYWFMFGYYQPHKAINRLNGIVHERDRRIARKFAIVGWSSYDPPSSIEYLTNSVNDNEFEIIFPIVVKQWAQKSILDSCLELVKSLERNQLSDRAVLAIGKRLTMVDYEYAWALIASISETTLKERGIEDFMMILGKRDPEKSREIIESVEDKWTRKTLIWYYFQSAPASGRLDFERDFKYLCEVKSRDRIMELLVGNTLDPASYFSKYIDPLELADEIEKLDCLGDEAKENLPKLLRGEED